MTNDLTAVRNAILQGRLTATDALVTSITSANSPANAHTYIRRFDAQARATATAVDAQLAAGAPLPRLAGLAVSIKDLFDVQAQPTTAASRVLAEAAPATVDSPAVARLRAAGAARVIFISSEAGQFDGGMRPDGLSYAVSKAALNAASVVIASALRPDGILVNAVHPGWVRTGMGGPDAPLQPEQATATALMLATLPPDGPSGCFFFEGREIPW
jgi:amidase/aspartyl-tRNA(Asn)/glutamyl-tRNA(Gln) amidotransferase subunit A